MNPEWTREQQNNGIREVPQDILEWQMAQEFRGISTGVYVTSVEDHSPGYVAGLREGDRIILLDDKPASFYTFSHLFQSKDGKARKLQVRGQDNSIREVMLTPTWNADIDRWVIGIEMADVSSENLTIPEGEDHQRIAFELGEDPSLRGYVEIARSDSKRSWEKVVSKYVLFFSSNDGRLMEVDLLERWQISGGRCLVDPDLTTGGVYSFQRKKVVVSQLFAWNTPHILSHESRHAHQHADPRFKGKLSFYEPPTSENYGDDTHWTGKVRSEGLDILSQALVEGGIVNNTEEADILLKETRDKFDRHFRRNREATKVVQTLSDSEIEAMERLRKQVNNQIKQFFDWSVWTSFLDHVFKNGSSNLFDGVRVEFEGVDSRELNRNQRDRLQEVLQKALTSELHKGVLPLMH
ncbi:MAG: hypothetical protein UY76_C0028G0001, partial [Candidatus Uhrbacteria bacterium GW2011_GWA2_52_8d]